MSLSVGYVLEAAVDVAGGADLPGWDLTVAELAELVEIEAATLLAAHRPHSSIFLAGDDRASTVRRLAAAVVGMALASSPEAADHTATVDARRIPDVSTVRTEVWSTTPLLRLGEQVVDHGTFLSRLEKVPLPGWPVDLVTAVRDMNRLGRWAMVRQTLDALPDVKRHEDPRGTRWCVHNRLVARVEDAATLLVRCDFPVREQYLTDHPATFSVRPALEAHRKVLADVAVGDPAAISAAILAAWQLQQ